MTRSATPSGHGTTRTIVRILDLRDAAAGPAYDDAHAAVPPAVIETQRRHGIVEMAIYRLGDRLVMVAELASGFDEEALERDYASDPVLIEWQQRMGALQRPVEGFAPWAEMTCVFRQSEAMPGMLISGKERT